MPAAPVVDSPRRTRHIWNSWPVSFISQPSSPACPGQNPGAGSQPSPVGHMHAAHSGARLVWGCTEPRVLHVSR